MEREQIEKSLDKKFTETLLPGEKRKIVFWYDMDEQFLDLIDELELTSAKIHRLTDRNYFQTKYLLEVEDTESNYLIYANSRPARDEDNWMIDTLLYSYEFYADRLLLHMEELGINMALKSVVKRYEKFFNSSERRKKLGQYGISNYDEASLEIAIMAVLCSVKFVDQLEIFKKVLGDSLDGEKNRYLADISRLMDDQVFWKNAGRYFGYTREETSLKKLAAHVFINSLTRTLNEQELSPLKEYLSDHGRANCVYFIDQWMNHKADAPAFERLSAAIDKSLNLSERLEGVPAEEISVCDGFEGFDKQILRYILDSIANNMENYEFCLRLIENRRTRHWYEKYSSIYEALYYTFKILQYKKSHPAIPMLNQKKLWEAYTSDYYFIDYCYRYFYWHYDQNPVEALKPVRSTVENIYSNWFLEGLGTAWSAALTACPDSEWQVDGITGQQDFYKRELEQAIIAGERYFVIISDALRYEVAVDITNRLNAETVGVAKLDNLLGVLPSSTKYGMAALLPHKDLSLNDKEQVLADNYKTDGLPERQTVLRNKESEAIASDYKSIIAMNKEERRELIKGKKLIYIYHDTIDAIGHPAATEIKVFDAAQQSIEEIYRLIRIIRGDLGGTNILITADHGFLYKRDPLPESDKIKKETLGAFEEKRRYMLSNQEVESESVMKFKPAYLKSAAGSLVVYVPRAAIRFKVQGGGANFVHGGASLQEVVVPLIKYKAMRGSSEKQKEERKVKIKLANESRKISNNLFTLEFFQTEKVDEKHVPRTVEIFLEDEAGTVLTNRETIIADKDTDKPAERTFKLRLILKTGDYDKKKDYFLIIKDTDTELVEDKIPFKINLAISSDFDL